MGTSRAYGGRIGRRCTSVISRFGMLVSALSAVAFSAVFAGGCENKRGEESTSRPPRGKLQVGTIHRTDGWDDQLPLRTETPEGDELKIREAYLVVAAVEIHACVPGNDYEPRGAPMLNGIYETFVPPARAHVPSSTTRLGTPFVDDLLGEVGRARISGALAPPYAAYCEAHAVVAPGDADVVNSTSAATESIVGKSILVRGSRKSPDSGSWSDFELEGGVRRTIEIEVVDPKTGEGHLVLSPSASSAMLLFETTISPEVFAVDPDEPGAASKVVERLAERTGIYSYDQD